MVRVQRHWPVLWCAWASQCSNGHVGQVEGSSRASGGFGHGGRPSDHVGSVGVVAMASEGVTVGRVGSYGSVWMRRGRPELRAGLLVSRWPVGSSRQPRRHGDDGEARRSPRAPAGWSRRARDLPVASANGTGESRRHQALPAILATAVGARTGGRVLGLVVGCSDRWLGARTGGRVLGPVVGCSDRWSSTLVVATSWRRRCERGMCARYGVRGTWRGLQRPRARST